MAPGNGIYRCDCMEGMREMPDDYVDLAIVDPPYGIGVISSDTKGNLFRGDKNIKRNYSWNENINIPTDDYFFELYRISKNRIIWGCNYFVYQIKDVGRIVFDKTDGGSAGLGFSDADLASHSFGVNIKTYRHRWMGILKGKGSRKEERIHPTQKPVALYKWLLHNYAKEGDLILDTHMGSGSSYIACLDMSFDYIGYEIDTDYFKAIEERVYYFTRQTKLAL